MALIGGTPRESVSFDRIAHRYDETRGGMERGRRYASVIHPLLAEGGPILEIGVGTGLVALGLTELGRDVAGVDISREMMGRARERIGARVAEGDAIRLPLRDASIVGAYAAHVLHLVSDMRLVLSELVRVLRRGGRFLTVWTENEAAPDNDLQPILDEMNDALRERRDSVERVDALAAQAGLTPVGLHRSDPFELTGDSPGEHAAKLESRTFSALWDIQQSRWESIVEPAIAALRRLPDQERRRTIRGVVNAHVFERT